MKIAIFNYTEGKLIVREFEGHSNPERKVVEFCLENKIDYESTEWMELFSCDIQTGL